MAMRVDPTLVGADVSKAELWLARQDVAGVQVVVNERGAIRKWLKGLPQGSRLAVEATNVYHLALVEEAHALGHQVFVVDGYRLNRYRESVGQRTKTDRTDAALLLRYLKNEGQDLRPWTPPSAGYLALHRLLHRRATLVQTRTSLRESLADLPELKASVRAVLKRLDNLVIAIEKRLNQLNRAVGRQADVERCQAIEGIGPITSTALANAFVRGHFRSSDAYIAFLGMDVRVRDSGKRKGKRCLTKQGDPEIRRLLYMAAMAAKRTARWKPFYERHIARGLQSTQAIVALARKLARVAFALMKNQSDYNPALVG